MLEGAASLTVLSVEQDLEAVGLVVVERLSDFLDGLLVRQLSVHKTVKGNGAAVNSDPTLWRFSSNTRVFVAASKRPLNLMFGFYRVDR